MFPIKLTLTVSTQDELDKVTAMVKGTPVKATPAEKIGTAKTEATTAANKAVKAAQKEPAAEDTVLTEYSAADAKQFVIDMVKAKGRDAAVTLLGEHGAKLATDLKGEALQAFCAAAKAALAS